MKVFLLGIVISMLMYHWHLMLSLFTTEQKPVVMFAAVNIMLYAVQVVNYVIRFCIMSRNSHRLLAWID